MKFDLGINNALVMTDHLDWQPTVLSVGIKEGRFAYVGENRIYPDDARTVLNLDQKILMPGLVNGHCHGDMTIVRGMGDGLTLQEQNEAFAEHNWFDRFLTEDDRFISRQLTYAEALRSGCTFILENMYWSLGLRAVDAMQLSGIRGALADDYRPDFRAADVAHDSSYLRRFADHCRTAGIVPVLGSVSEEDFAPDVLRTVRALAAEADMLITCHLAETPWRIDLIRERYGVTPVMYLAEAGFLGPDIIASHVVYTTPEERALLAASKTKVINTPLCEYKISDGLAAVPAMLGEGITVGLGTDGALWNNSIDLFREMKGIVLANALAHGPRSLSPQQALRMATIGGARAFSLADLGDIREGCLADFILINYQKSKFHPVRTGRFENVSSSLVFNATGEDVDSVFVAGEAVVLDGRLLSMDEAALLQDIQSRSERLMRQL